MMPEVVEDGLEFWWDIWDAVKVGNPNHSSSFSSSPDLEGLSSHLRVTWQEQICLVARPLVQRLVTQVRERKEGAEVMKLHMDALVDEDTMENNKLSFTTLFSAHFPSIASTAATALNEAQIYPERVVSEENRRASTEENMTERAFLELYSSPAALELTLRLCFGWSMQCFHFIIAEVFHSEGENFSLCTANVNEGDDTPSVISQGLLDCFLINLFKFFVECDEKKALLTNEKKRFTKIKNNHERNSEVQQDIVSQLADEIGKRAGNVSALRDYSVYSASSDEKRVMSPLSTSQSRATDFSLVSMALRCLPELWNYFLTASTNNSGASPSLLPLRYSFPWLKVMAKEFVTSYFNELTELYDDESSSLSVLTARLVKAIRMSLLSSPEDFPSTYFSLTALDKKIAFGEGMTTTSSDVNGQPYASSISAFSIFAQFYLPCWNVAKDERLGNGVWWTEQLSSLFHRIVAVERRILLAEFEALEKIKEVDEKESKMEGPAGSADVMSKAGVNRPSSSMLYTRLAPLREAAFHFSDVLASTARELQGLIILVLPYLAMLSAVFYDGMSMREQISKRRKTIRSRDHQSGAFSCSFNTSFIEEFADHRRRVDPNGFMKTNACILLDASLRESLTTFCQSTMPSAPFLNEKEYSEHLLLGLALLLDGDGVWRYMLEVAQAPLEFPSANPDSPTSTSLPINSPTLCSLNQEEELRRSNRLSSVFSDQRARSAQRAVAYQRPKTPSPSDRSTFEETQAVVLQAFYPRYFVLFAALDNGLEQLCTWISSSPYAGKFLSMPTGSKGNQASDSNACREYFSLLLPTCLTIELQYLLRGYRVKQNPYASIVVSEIVMFLATVAGKEAKEAKAEPASATLGTNGATSEDAPHEEPPNTSGMQQILSSQRGCAFFFLRRSLISWLSWKESSSQSHQLEVFRRIFSSSALLPSRKNEDNYVLSFLYHRIVSEGIYGYLTFFLSSLRAVGVDDSVVEGWEDLMLVAHAVSTDATQSIAIQGMGAALIFVRELPKAGYCSAAVPSLAENLFEDSLHWWEKNLFQYFDSDEKMQSVISALKQAKGRAPMDEESVAKQKVEEDDGESPTKNTDLLDAVALPISVQCLLGMLLECGTIVVQRLLGLCSVEVEPLLEWSTVPKQREVAPIELDVLKAFLCGFWRLCDEIEYISLPHGTVPAKVDASVEMPCHLGGQRVKYILLSMLSESFGVSVPLDFPAVGMTLVSFLLYLVEQKASTASSPATGGTVLQRNLSHLLQKLHYEDVEYDRLETVTATMLSCAPGGGPKGLLRRCNLDYRTSLDAGTLLQKRTIITHYGAKKKEQAASNVKKIKEAIEKDLISINYGTSSSEKKVNEKDDGTPAGSVENQIAKLPLQASNDSEEVVLATEGTTYFTCILKGVLHRALVSPVEAAGGAEVLRQLLLYLCWSREPKAATHLSKELTADESQKEARFFYASAAGAIEGSSRLSKSLCKLLTFGERTLSSSSTRKTVFLPLTMSEFSGIGIALLVILETIIELHDKLSTFGKTADGKEKKAWPRQGDLLPLLRSSWRYCLQDLTFAMRQLLKVQDARTDAAVLHLAQQFRHYLSENAGFGDVIEAARKRIKIKQTEPNTTALQQLLILPIKLPERLSIKNFDQKEKSEEDRKRRHRDQDEERHRRKHRHSRERGRKRERDRDHKELRTREEGPSRGTDDRSSSSRRRGERRRH